MIVNEAKITKKLNQFVNIVKNLRLFTEKESATFTGNILSEVEMAFKKYKNHPSVNAITEQMKIQF